MDDDDTTDSSSPPLGNQNYSRHRLASAPTRASPLRIATTDAALKRRSLASHDHAPLARSGSSRPTSSPKKRKARHRQSYDATLPVESSAAYIKADMANDTNGPSLADLLKGVNADHALDILKAVSAPKSPPKGPSAASSLDSKPSINSVRPLLSSSPQRRRIELPQDIEAEDAANASNGTSQADQTIHKRRISMNLSPSFKRGKNKRADTPSPRARSPDGTLAIKSPELRAFEAQINHLRIGVTPETLDRANTAKRFFESRYRFLCEPVSPAVHELIQVANWRHINANIIREVMNERKLRQPYRSGLEDPLSRRNSLHSDRASMNVGPTLFSSGSLIGGMTLQDAFPKDQEAIFFCALRMIQPDTPGDPISPDWSVRPEDVRVWLETDHEVLEPLPPVPTPKFDADHLQASPSRVAGLHSRPASVRSQSYHSESNISRRNSTRSGGAPRPPVPLSKMFDSTAKHRPGSPHPSSEQDPRRSTQLEAALLRNALSTANSARPPLSDPRVPLSQMSNNSLELASPNVSDSEARRTGKRLSQLFRPQFRKMSVGSSHSPNMDEPSVAFVGNQSRASLLSERSTRQPGMSALVEGMMHAGTDFEAGTETGAEEDKNLRGALERRQVVRQTTAMRDADYQRVMGVLDDSKFLLRELDARTTEHNFKIKKYEHTHELRSDETLPQLLKHVVSQPSPDTSPTLSAKPISSPEALLSNSDSDNPHVTFRLSPEISTMPLDLDTDLATPKSLSKLRNRRMTDAPSLRIDSRRRRNTFAVNGEFAPPVDSARQLAESLALHDQRAVGLKADLLKMQKMQQALFDAVCKTSDGIKLFQQKVSGTILNDLYDSEQAVLGLRPAQRTRRSRRILSVAISLVLLWFMWIVQIGYWLSGYWLWQHHSWLPKMRCRARFAVWLTWLTGVIGLIFSLVHWGPLACHPITKQVASSLLQLDFVTFAYHTLHQALP